MYRLSRSITVRQVRSIKITPSVSRSFYELVAETGSMDYRIVLSPGQLLEMIKSAERAVKGESPPVEQRATTTMPMNPDQLFVVRILVAAHTTTIDRVEPMMLYHSMFNAWRRGYYSKLARGTMQQFIRQDDVENLPLQDGRLKTVATVGVLKQHSVMAGDILVQRVSGTKENVGRPFFVEKPDPLLIRGAEVG